MEAIGAKRKRIIAIIGPAIQKKSYEIGEDVAKIIKQFSFYEPSNDILYSIENNKYLFDLPLLLKQSLKYSKIDQVGDTKLDTYQNNDLFFSHRRTTHESDLKESKTGRQISLVGRSMLFKCCEIIMPHLIIFFIANLLLILILIFI